MNNLYLKSEITNQIIVARRFITVCENAATKDDGIISKDEEKAIAKIKKLTEKYIKELNSLL